MDVVIDELDVMSEEQEGYTTANDMGKVCCALTASVAASGTS